MKERISYFDYIYDTNNRQERLLRLQCLCFDLP